MGKFDLKINSDFESLDKTLLDLQNISDNYLDGKLSNLKEIGGLGYHIRGKYDTKLDFSNEFVEKEVIPLFNKIYETIPDVRIIAMAKDDQNYILSYLEDKKVNFTRQVGESYNKMSFETLYEPVGGINENLYTAQRKISWDKLNFVEMDTDSKNKINKQIEITPLADKITA